MARAEICDQIVAQLSAHEHLVRRRSAPLCGVRMLRSSMRLRRTAKPSAGVHPGELPVARDGSTQEDSWNGEARTIASRPRPADLPFVMPTKLRPPHLRSGLLRRTELLEATPRRKGEDAHARLRTGGLREDDALGAVGGGGPADSSSRGFRSTRSDSDPMRLWTHVIAGCSLSSTTLGRRSLPALAGRPERCRRDGPAAPRRRALAGFRPRPRTRGLARGREPLCDQTMSVLVERMPGRIKSSSRAVPTLRCRSRGCAPMANLRSFGHAIFASRLRTPHALFREADSTLRPRRPTTHRENRGLARGARPGDPRTQRAARSASGSSRSSRATRITSSTISRAMSSTNAIRTLGRSWCTRRFSTSCLRPSATLSRTLGIGPVLTEIEPLESIPCLAGRGGVRVPVSQPLRDRPGDDSSRQRRRLHRSAARPSVALVPGARRGRARHRARDRLQGYSTSKRARDERWRPTALGRPHGNGEPLVRPARVAGGNEQTANSRRSARCALGSAALGATRSSVGSP